MTISAVVNRASFTGNDSTTAFAFPYPFHAQADLVVVSTVIATGVQTVKALVTHYTISGTADAQGHYPDGGTVNFLTAPASTESITIYRDPALIQSVNLTENDSLPVESAVEAPFDYLTMICQRLSDRLSRALRQPEGDTASIDLLPAKVTRASMYLAFDSDGDPIAADAPTDTALTSAFIETLLDDVDAATARATLGVPALTGLANAVCDFRLTLTTLTPVTTSDVLAAETLYCTPYKGNRISLFDGTDWNLRASAEMSIDVPDATNCYDVFCYDNAGVPTLELTAWTNETTRATALALQNGVLSKTGALTRRYLGTFYSTTAGNGQIEDSVAKRHLWNHYHRVARPMRVSETEDAWTYTTATIRQAFADTANQLDFVIGVSEDMVSALAIGLMTNTNVGVAAHIVIGLDSTTAMASGCLAEPGITAAANGWANPAAYWKGYPGVGRHILTWLEYSAAVGTTEWRGDAGAPTRQQSGIQGEVWG
jgi:hypothetical protein